MDKVGSRVATSQHQKTEADMPEETTNSESNRDVVDVAGLQARLALTFHDEDLLTQAMTHRSYANENEGDILDNERLEFLGDAVLNFLTGDMLYRRYPDSSEGRLTRLRSALVRTEALKDLAVECELGETLRMGKGEENSGGRERSSNLCAAFEALVGALYLDQGLDAVREFVIPKLDVQLERVLRESLHRDARTLLQEWSQGHHGVTPTYRTVEESGPDHHKEFVVEVSIEEDTAGRGVGRSKRTAAQAAARDALRIIRESQPELEQTQAEETPST